MSLIVHQPEKFEIDASKAAPEDLLEIHMDDFKLIYVAPVDDGFELLKGLAPDELVTLIDQATQDLPLCRPHVFELKQRKPLKIALRRDGEVLGWLPEFPSRVFMVQPTTLRRMRDDFIMRMKNKPRTA